MKTPDSSSQQCAALRRHLAVSLRESWRRYRKKLRSCQRHFSEESVHAFRVETRRLQSLLDLLGAFVSARDLDKARRLLKKNLEVFADLRDTQVQLAWVRSLRRSDPALEPFHAHLQRRERRLIKSTASSVKAFKTARLKKCVTGLKKKLAAACEAPEKRSRCRQAVSQVVAQAFERVMKLRRRIDGADPATIHRTRVAFKKFRYMVESLQPALPLMSAAQCRRMRDYQAMMGEIHDLEVLAAHLDKLVAKGKLAAAPLRAFRKSLARRQAMQISAYLRSTEQLDTFRPRFRFENRS